MNNRVKLLRKTLGLSGEKFGAKLGVKRNSISQIETGKNNLTEQMLLSICREFNVNEEWLRTGQGEIFVEHQNTDLDTLAEQQQVDPLEMEIIKAYFALDKDTRKTLVDHFKNHFAKEQSDDLV